ncbi:acyl-CoA dehydrogenase family protein [Nocardia brevicatena]|uniref:acyl-CoA dehydrogenase family protein n=1 Tax=Nocardia brevicatena TaxID=37327 RepID=UPI000317FF14|nr:acyl-CoA dehydrogenase family protein [Nocardia brevicatena]
MTLFASEPAAVTASIIDRIGIDTDTPAASSDTAVWAALAETGFTAIGVPEDKGGSGGTSADALAVLAAAAEAGALTPLAEHMILASRLAAECGFAVGERTATVAIADRRCLLRAEGDNFVLDGPVSGVVHGRTADLLIVVCEPDTDDRARRPDEAATSHGAEAGGRAIAVVAGDAPGISVTEGTDLVGAPVDDLVFTATPVEFRGESPLGSAELWQRGALAYSVALAGAARAVRDQTLRHAAERTQFGRPLTKFQAVQQRLATLGALTAMMETATDAAVATPGESTAVAAAKAVTSAAAGEVAAIGHQIHGAIGFTSEHRLGRFTTSLWSWRERYGDERYWADSLAERILEGGADVWDIVAGGVEYGDI